MRRWKIIILVIVLNMVNLWAEDSLVVDFGNKKISVADFKRRIEMTPWPYGRTDNQNQNFKSDFLISMIGEKLLSIAATNENADSSVFMKYALNHINKLFIRDGLYKREISDKVEMSDKEVNEAVQRSMSIFYMRFIETRDSSEIIKIFNLLLSGVDFDSVLVERAEYNLQKEKIGMSYGTMPTELENVLYNLKPHSYSRPVYSDGKYYILKVDTIVSAENKPDYNLEKIIKSATKKLRERKERELYKTFSIKFFADKKGKINEKAYILTTQCIINIIQQEFAQIDSATSNKKVFVNFGTFNEAEKLLGSALYDTLIFSDTSKITVENFLYKMLMDETVFTDSSVNYIKRVVQQKIKNTIYEEYLAIEGFKQNIQSEEKVRKDIEEWVDNLNANAFSIRLMKEIKISQKEVDDLYNLQLANTNKQVDVYRVQEILLDSLEEIEYYLNRLNKGEDFGKIASSVSKRIWAKQNKGELGLITSGMYGEIGKTASGMAVNEIYAPVKTDSGYSIIKLLDIKKRNISENKSVQERKNEIRENLFQEKYNKLRDSIVVKYAQIHIKNINYELLKKIKVTGVNSFMYRYFGFGGKLSGVPIMQRYESWYDKWENKIQLTP